MTRTGKETQRILSADGAAASADVTTTEHDDDLLMNVVGMTNYHSNS